MDFPQSLYSQRIYRINKLIGNLKEVFGLDEYFVGFDTLNYYTLKFNWYAIHQERWRFDTEIVHNIKCCYKNHESKWKSLFSKLKALNQIALNESVRKFEGEIEEGSPDAERIHYHLTNMYQSYPIDSDKFLDGVIYDNFRRLKKGNNRLTYAKGTFLADDKNYIIYPPIKFQFFFLNGSDVANDESICPQEKHEYASNRVHSNASHSPQGAPYDLEDIYFRYIVPLLVGFEDPGQQTRRLFNGKVGKKPGCNKDKYLFSTDDIKKGISGLKCILCIPVYDAVIGNNTYGNLYGNLSIAFSEEDTLNSFIEKSQNDFGKMAILLSMAKVDPTLR